MSNLNHIWFLSCISTFFARHHRLFLVLELNPHTNWQISKHIINSQDRVPLRVHMSKTICNFFLIYRHKDINIYLINTSNLGKIILRKILFLPISTTLRKFLMIGNNYKNNTAFQPNLSFLSLCVTHKNILLRVNVRMYLHISIFILFVYWKENDKEIKLVIRVIRKWEIYTSRCLFNKQKV